MSKEESKDDAPKTVALDAGDLKLLQTYGIGPYTRAIKTLEGSITDEMKKIVDLIGA
jgi:26S proteasome regulatory subunit T1